MPKTKSHGLEWSHLYTHGPLLVVDEDRTVERGPNTDPRSIPVPCPRYDFVGMWHDTWKDWLDAQKKDPGR